MKIRELKFVGAADCKKLGDEKANMSVEEYVDWIKMQNIEGKRINKFFKTLYDQICNGYPELSTPVQNDEPEEKSPLQCKLEEISIDEMQYHVDNYTKHGGDLKRNGVKTLWQLYSSHFGSRLKFEIVAHDWQQILMDKSAEIISGWERSKTTKVYPVVFDREKGLIDNLRRAILELSEELNRRVGDSRYSQTLKYESFDNKTFALELVAKILQSYYKEGKSEDEIVRESSLTAGWWVKDAHRKTVAAFTNGDKMSENLRLNDDIVNWIRTIKNDYLFHTEDELEKVVGLIDEQMFYLLNLDFVDVEGVRFIIPKDTKGTYEQIGGAIISALRETVIPKDLEEILERIENHKKMKKVEKEYNQTFIDNVLSCNALIDRNEKGEISLKAEFLSSGEQKIARIIYEADSPITRVEANSRYEAIYGNPASIVQFTQLKKYGINNQGTLWSCTYSKTLEPIQSFIRKYAEDQEVFFYSDLESYLKEHEYIIPSSIRTYITNVCQVDNNDRMHFCYKEVIEKYPQYSWRNQSREGLTNWILNRINDYLDNWETVSLAEIYDYVEKQSKGTDYEIKIKERVQAAIGTYSGDGQPFLSDGTKIKKNKEYYDTSDFNVLGLRGGKYSFFKQIRSIVLNEIKKAEDGRLLLTDVVDLINGNIDEKQSRNTIIRAITNKRLPPINVEIQNINDNLYIVKSGEDMVAEPVFEIKPSINIEETDALEETEIAQEVVNPVDRPNISYRLTFNLAELKTAMKRELSFYRNWMMYDHIDIDEAIEKFIQFIKNAENDNIKRKLPQNLYEYWFASTDSFDRNMYVVNLAIFYEGILSEIKYQKHGVRLNKKGLGDWALEYPVLAKCMGLPTRLARGFERIFQDLYYKRNKFAHGESVEMSSSDTAKTISDYVALYIFTVAKYV